MASNVKSRSKCDMHTIVLHNIHEHVIQLPALELLQLLQNLLESKIYLDTASIIVFDHVYIIYERETRTSDQDAVVRSTQDQYNNNCIWIEQIIYSVWQWYADKILFKKPLVQPTWLTFNYSV